jgi:hypothetical protein
MIPKRWPLKLNIDGSIAQWYIEQVGVRNWAAVFIKGGSIAQWYRAVDIQVDT